MKMFPCPCCNSRVYEEPPKGDYSICPVCLWEDDPIQKEDPDYEGGANRMSLNQARASFLIKAGLVNLPK